VILHQLKAHGKKEDSFNKFKEKNIREIKTQDIKKANYLIMAANNLTPYMRTVNTKGRKECQLEHHLMKKGRFSIKYFQLKFAPFRNKSIAHNTVFKS
jgi:hypothetical protein